MRHVGDNLPADSQRVVAGSLRRGLVIQTSISTRRRFKRLRVPDRLAEKMDRLPESDGQNRKLMFINYSEDRTLTDGLSAKQESAR